MRGIPQQNIERRRAVDAQHIARHPHVAINLFLAGILYLHHALATEAELQHILSARINANDPLRRHCRCWTRALAREQGYVETLFGRRLHLPEINARNKMRVQAAERTAINAPMQGTAADIIKRAMLAVDDWLQGSDADAHMIMQVHDELVFEVASDQVEAVSGKICELMSGAAQLEVPLVVESGAGDNWDQAH